MNELIKTQNGSNGEVLVSGRDLHEFLDSKERFSKWFEKMTSYGLEVGVDYTPYQTVHPQNKQTIEDFALKLDAAKEISMLQRNEKGKEARQYFLELERKWNSPEMVMKRAMDYLNERVASLTTTTLVQEQKINELQPKATYYDLILQNKSLISTTLIAKDYGMSAITLNKKLKELGVQYKQGEVWLLYSKYQDKGYTQTTVHAIDSERSSNLMKWRQAGRMFIYDLLKSKGILPMIECV